MRDIHFGFSTEEEHKNLQQQDKVSSTDIKAFKQETAITIISIVKRMAEKNPSNYYLFRTADVFYPVLLVTFAPLHL